VDPPAGRARAGRHAQRQSRHSRGKWNCVQSYGGYTPALAERNRQFVEAAGGAPTLVFEISPVFLDNNYPTLLDPTLYVSLLTHFELTHAVRTALVFARRPQPLARTRSLLMTRTVRLGEPLEIAAPEGAILWAEIETEPDAMGTVISRFKTYPLSITLTAGTRTAVHRLLPEMARSGFLLSPYLGHPHSYLFFYSQDPRVKNRLEPVRSITVAQPRAGRWSMPLLYKNAVNVRIYQIALGHADRR
jgi:hypothetical protein